MMIRIKELKVDNLKVPYQVKQRLTIIQQAARNLYWLIEGFHINNYILNLSKDDMKCNIYLSTLTVQTTINHPKKGRGQLNRKRLSLSEVVSILENPRKHTGKGYYKK